MESFAQRTGYYAGVPRDIRLEQITYLEDLTETLYPSLRVYLYDARKLFSSTITAFGQLLCVFYVGSGYMAAHDNERIEIFTPHFDQLVKQADLSARGPQDRLRLLKTSWKHDTSNLSQHPMRPRDLGI
jgi:hypothetical protein